jgi:magnesium chelatase subunit D
MSNSSNTPQTRSATQSVYPFSAIVGQDEMKLALVLNVIDPLLGGVLIMGHRGTGKSTAVRGLAELLPQISVVTGCAYRCDPDDHQDLCAECQAKQLADHKLPRQKMRVAVVELPLGATEDRVCGSIDIERALRDAKKTFEPGLLARANRGFLYIDEVNLLEDHLVDLLLDVAVTGRNRVERESVSVEHPARFVLIGSGNPEEGELRPQLLDRFGLQVEVTTENDPEQRVEIVERRELFETERDLFLSQCEKDQQQLRKKIVRAQNSFASVKIERRLLRKIAELCTELKLDGHRGELTITRTSRALAAFENRKQVTEAEVKRVAAMSLRHRLRREPFAETASAGRIEQALDKVFNQPQRKGAGDDGGHSGNGRKALRGDHGSLNDEGLSKSRSASPKGNLGKDSNRVFQISQTQENRSEMEFKPEHEHHQRSSSKLARSNRRQSRSKTVLNSQRGRYARATEVQSDGFRVALDATLRAGDLRYKQFSRKEGALYILAIDTSGSMAPRRINRAREVALGLLRQSYIKRDSVAIVVFRGTSATVVLPPSRSMLRAKRALDSLAVGGGTPLSAGVLCSIELAKRAQSKHGRAVVLLFTDGRANVSLRAARTGSTLTPPPRQEQIGSELLELGRELNKAGFSAVVIETQNRFNSNGDARQVAERLGARFVQSK